MELVLVGVLHLFIVLMRSSVELTDCDRCLYCDLYISLFFIVFFMLVVTLLYVLLPILARTHWQERFSISMWLYWFK